MIQVLIISSLYSQTQHLRRILLGQAGHIQLCGTADNSVLGMSLIESLHPDVVIMPVHMTFWNPEDLINSAPARDLPALRPAVRRGGGGH